ncbi:RAMP superfamily CRISPR-associated protein [Rhodococcus sp. BS-15]|uniref:RAMP superfamily CRISPR-associated protein n=1 Tax=Rhodococcus sp. BS-15 TaxID=1304954 RepID=UPI000B08B9C6|nr:RAMP superfamily CRISPR-associated protein [Rhodococcus sp. BS-15]
MTATRVWDLDITARAPISHRGEMIGTTAMFRRMKVIQPDSTIALVPVVSGNSFRGVLRRLGEEMLRDALEYDHLLPLAVAHMLRNGGSIVKSNAEPITGRRLQQLRTLIPHLSVFGGAIGSAPISGCLQVGHVVPLVAEAIPILRFDYDSALPSRFDVETLESYSHLDDVSTARDTTPATGSETSTPPTPLMRYEIEALAPGTRFETFVQISRGTDVDIDFTADVLREFCDRGWLGGRTGIGHGQVTTGIAPALDDNVGTLWRTAITARRDEALDALVGLTK